MILGNRRLRILYMALAGMDMAVLLPWLTNLIIFWGRNGDERVLTLQAMLTLNPLLLFIIFWATMLFYMLLTDLLDRWGLSGGLHAVAILGVLTITSLLAVRFLLYPEIPLGNFTWLRETIFAIINLVSGVRGEILLILTNYFLWLRVARYTDRTTTFFGVGLSFRLGMLLVVLGSTLLAQWNNEINAAITYLFLFYAFGLCAVAIARIDQKAVGTANSSGSLLPWPRLTQLWVIIIAILSTSFAIATVYTPRTLRTVLGWFSPIGDLIQWLLMGFAYVLFWLLTPLLEWLTARMQTIVGESDPMQLQPGEPMELFPPGEAMQELAFMRYCLSALVIFVAIALILIFITRMTRRNRTDEVEETESEGSLRPGRINLGLDRLKDWFALLGRYGLGNQLLAAISVENIYANLTRLARTKGFPRPPSQSPDHYLPTLLQAFPGHETELTEITTAYLRVRYADRPINPTELESIRTAYTTITTAQEQNKNKEAKNKPRKG